MNYKAKSTLEKLEKNMRFKNYSERTIEVYVNYAEKFLKSFDNDIYHISQKQAKQWLIDYNYSSISQQNQIISAVKALYKYVVNSKLVVVNIERPRKEKKLPVIIDKDFLLDKISKIENLKHKAIISLGASVGLRVSEVVNLKITDIDSDRMVINIRNAKGKKDRIVPLSENILNLLREYFKNYKPKEYLFNGQSKLMYTASSCNKLVKKYIRNDYHYHLLRHFTFTNLVDQGIDISYVQKLAGHNDIKTTSIYVHLSNVKSLPLAL